MRSKKWIATAVGLCACMSFVACGGDTAGNVDDTTNGGENGGQNVHTHAFVEKNTAGTYLKTGADCTTPAEYFYACTCGERGSETYFFGEALGHDYKDGVCEVCEDECAHTETEWKTDVEAGCFMDGTKTLVCKTCEERVESDGIEATGHAFVDGTCSKCQADLWDGTANVSWYTGDKTEYFIYTAEQLAGVSQLAQEGNTFEGVTLTLSAGIDLDGREWMPIGSDYTNWFMGTFNGGGKDISNMKITASHNYAGLFGLVAPQGTIKDFTLYNIEIDISSGYGSVGGIAGSCTGVAQNCGVTGKISVGASMTTSSDFSETCNVGGAFGNIVNATNVFADCEVKNVYDEVPTQINIQRQIGGFAGSVGQATNCYALGDVVYDARAETDYDKVSYAEETLAVIGGFSGRGAGQLTNCYATGDVSATGTFISYVGGFSGRLGGSISSCYAEGDVTVNSYDTILAGGYTGGLIGELEVGFIGTVEYSYATGNVSMITKASSDVGGLIGRNSSNHAGKISCVYATGNVTLEGGRQCTIGGLIGFNYSYALEKAYATGDVTITNTDEKATTSNYLIDCKAGGLIGRTSGSVTNAYASGNVTAVAYSDAEARVDAYAGGLIGYITDSQLNSEYSEKVTVANTYASGDVSLTVRAVSGNHTSYPAGLIAYLDYAKVSRSFATGNVVRTMNTEGGGCYISPLVGKNVPGAQRKVDGCYVAKGRKLTTTIGTETSETLSEEYPIYGQIPNFIELADLQKVSFYTGSLVWSTDVWNMADGEYPTLYW